LIEENLTEENLTEENVIGENLAEEENAAEESPSEEVFPESLEIPAQESVPEKESLKPALGASIFEDPFAKLLTGSQGEGYFEENEKKDDDNSEKAYGWVGNADENDGEERKRPRWEFLEWEATRFAKRLRSIEQMRRASSLYKRSGFRGSRGFFVTSCILALFLVGTAFAAYRHLQRNSYASLMGGAQALYDQEQYEPAFNEYKRASDRYSKRFEPLLGMARAAERVGRVEEAIMAYRAGLELFPANAAPSRSGTFYEIGRLYAALKAWDKAQENFQEAAAMDATNYGAYFALGEALEAQDKPEEAIRAYKQALDLSPSSDAAQEAIRRMSLLLPPAETKQDSLTEQKYEHAMQVGSVALELKHYEEASRYFAEALAIRSDDVNAWVGFAGARSNLGDTAGAIKSLERALERDPDHEDAKSKLAELKEAQNKKRQPSRPRRAPRSRGPRSGTRIRPAGGSSPQPSSVGVADKALSRQELFGRGIDHYRKEAYAQAFETFAACLRSGEREAFPLAGEPGPLWKGFRPVLNVPSDVALLAEAVRLNPADRDLYLNLSMTGTKMGMDKKTWRTTLNDIYSHALAQR
jgi:tetratricopeptide (TPR) repeat protein